MRVKIKPHLQRQSEFSHYFATWASNHRGWCKMKKLNRKLAKKQMRRDSEENGGMKMKKIIVVCCLLLSFMLGACCVGTVSAEQNAPIKIWAQNTNGSYHTLCVVDEETGVNYIVVSTELSGSHRSIAITPRCDADGTLYTE